jgi:uncharacterized protein YjbI with pentapeptide repeats
MPTPEQLQEENERLRAELENYKQAAAQPPIWKRVSQFFFTPVELVLSFVIRLFKNFLDARIFLGVILTVGLIGFGMGMYYYGSLALFMAAGAVLAFIAWVFYMLKERAFQRQQEQFQQKVQQLSSTDNKPPLPLLVVDLLRSKDPSQKQQQAEQLKAQLQQLKPYVSESIQLVKAYATKFFAFNSFLSLFTVLTSISIGIIAFLQLEQLKQQNKLFKTQNDRVTEQTALMRSQDSLLRIQTQFIQRQLGQIDTQNLYIEEQIKQASIQNRLVTAQNELFTQQNIKIDAQTDLMERQTGQIDTQNLYIIEQIRQASIQNRLVTAQNKRLDQQTNLQEAERRSSLVFLFSNVMDAVDRELKERNNKQRKLSKQLIGRIIALSASLKPYKYLTEGDTLTSVLLSPERGQLLISLVESDLDSVTYLNIFRKANFEYADLKRANLSSAKLRDANLSSANLSSANLSSANLRGANLRNANLSDANLSDANLRNANLSFANLSFANLSAANLRFVNLSAANLSAANLRSSNLRNADLMYADLSSANLRSANLSFAYLRDANLSGADLSDADLRDANLRGANLSDADLRDANLRGANLRDANLSGADLSDADLRDAKTDELNFLTNPNQGIRGYEALQQNYYVDSIPQYWPWDREKKHPYYRIKPKPSQD